MSFSSSSSLNRMLFRTSTVESVLWEHLVICSAAIAGTLTVSAVVCSLVAASVSEHWSLTQSFDQVQTYAVGWSIGCYRWVWCCSWSRFLAALCHSLARSFTRRVYSAQTRGKDSANVYLVPRTARPSQKSHHTAATYRHPCRSWKVLEEARLWLGILPLTDTGCPSS